MFKKINRRVTRVRHLVKIEKRSLVKNLFKTGFPLPVWARLFKA